MRQQQIHFHELYKTLRYRLSEVVYETHYLTPRICVLRWVQWRFASFSYQVEHDDPAQILSSCRWRGWHAYMWAHVSCIC